MNRSFALGLLVLGCSHAPAPAPASGSPGAFEPRRPAPLATANEAARPAPVVVGSPPPARADRAPVVDEALPPFARAIVDGHARVRDGVTPPARPPLAPLRWDPALAELAQAWADGCPRGHRPDNRYGENMYFASGAIGSSPAEAALRAWSSEAPNYDYESTRCTRDGDAAWYHCGHYTQLVWRGSERVGCGVRTDCPGPFSTVLVCNYDPPGNVNATETSIPRPY